MRKSELAILAIILLSFVVGIYLFPQMSEEMASHWNINGNVDGYLPKFWGLFLMPLISLGLFLLFLVIPKIDPLEHNIKKFRKYFDTFVALFIVFLFYLYIITISWNFGMRFNIIQLLSPALGALFYYVGVLVEHAKRNWFIGIRTPWTLSSENVWEKTHKIGGKLFKITGIVALVGIFFPTYGLFFILIPVILVAAYTVVYSYMEYQKEIKPGS